MRANSLRFEFPPIALSAETAKKLFESPLGTEVCTGRRWAETLDRSASVSPFARKSFCPVAALSSGVFDAFGILLVRQAPLAPSEAAHLKNVYAEGLEPGQQPLQSRQIDKLAAQNGLDRLYGSGEVLKVEERLGRENSGNANLIVRWCHGWPPMVGTGHHLDHTMPQLRSWHATQTG